MGISKTLNLLFFALITGHVATPSIKIFRLGIIWELLQKIPIRCKKEVTVKKNTVAPSRKLLILWTLPFLKLQDQRRRRRCMRVIFVITALIIHILRHRHRHRQFHLHALQPIIIIIIMTTVVTADPAVPLLSVERPIATIVMFASVHHQAKLKLF